MQIRLTSSQSRAFDAGAPDGYDAVLHLAQEQAAEHGQACLVLDADGTLLYTAEPPEYCRSCHENPRAHDSNDSLYCWACFREFGDAYQLHRVAPFHDD